MPTLLAATVPAWMRLAMPEDVRQIEALCAWQAKTPSQYATLLKYELRELRRTQWDRAPRRRTRKPKSLRPSKIAHTTGYRHDSARHAAAYQDRIKS